MYKSWEKLHTRWLMAAMAAPLTQAASNCSWPAVLFLTLGCIGLCWVLERMQTGAAKTRALAALQWLWMLLVLSEFLHWLMLYWPNYSSYHGAPLILLALAAMSSAKGKENSARVGNVLLGAMAVLFGAVLISGLKQVEWINVKADWQIQTAYLIVVMLIPAMGAGLGETKKGGLALYALLVSVVTTGVLSIDLIRTMHAPFYEMSKSISFLGVGKRFESLVAVGMTIGCFALTSYLLRVMAQAWDRGKSESRSVWISAVFSGMIFLSGMRLNSRLLAAGTVGVWVILPVVEKISKKLKIPIDK